MAVVLVATPGAADANTYPTVAEFRAYWETRAPAPEWLANLASVPDATIAPYLVQGTRALDSAFKWNGQATDIDVQNLCFPRTSLLNRHGGALASDVIPRQLKEAVCEWAGQAGADDLSADNVAAKLGVVGVKAGSAAVSFQAKTSNKEAQETDVVRAGSDFFYLSVPDEVRRLLVPSWYEENTSLTVTGRPFVFEAIGGCD